MVRVVFVHPDLGIGGAERLVVDAALALQRSGHGVRVVTAHHDPNHCFTETRDGTVEVTCVGDWLPRSVCGRLEALCAYVRMVYVAVYVLMCVEFDVAFADQVSACVPVLKLKSRVIFYCHFPDQLLTQRKSLAKRIYRFFLDAVEERTTARADRVLVNSRFTAEVFRDTFRSIRATPSVLYPSLDLSRFDELRTLTLEEVGLAELAVHSKLFVSVNRYERKKNLYLALDALKALLEVLSEEEREGVHLVMAGGYDSRVDENVSHLTELQGHAKALGVQDKVTFLKSPSDQQKVSLMASALCLLYTPDREHFGIVPLESMYVETPVIAVESGGPKETVVSGDTGFLCPQEAEDFARAMASFVKNPGSSATMGKAGRQRVLSNFSFAKFSEHLNYIVQGLEDERKR